MRRKVILAVVLAFIGVLAALTIDDIIVYGVTPLDFLSILLLGFFSVAIVGALLTKPPGE